MAVVSAPAKPGTTWQRESAPVDVTDRAWVTIVWDDPVNLMSYVTYVFQKLFGYSEPHATKLMLQVHNEGKAVVSAGSRESMEVDVQAACRRFVGDDAAGPVRFEDIRDPSCAGGSASRPAMVPAFDRRWLRMRPPCSRTWQAR